MQALGGRFASSCASLGWNSHDSLLPYLLGFIVGPLGAGDRSCDCDRFIWRTCHDDEVESSGNGSSMYVLLVSIFDDSGSIIWFLFSTMYRLDDGVFESQ